MRLLFLISGHQCVLVFLEVLPYFAPAAIRPLSQKMAHWGENSIRHGWTRTVSGSAELALALERYGL
jgi:hypothetical protein